MLVCMWLFRVDLQAGCS